MPTPAAKELEEETKVEGQPSTSCVDAMDEEEEAKSSSHRKHRARKRKKYGAVRKQMEFYFSDANITKNRMMREMIQDSEFVDLTVFLGFNKVASICSDLNNLQRSLKESDKLELSTDMNQVKRKVPFDESKVKSDEEVENCTIYVENIPTHVSHEWIEKVFHEYGPVAYISLPKYKNNGQPKGFAFVEYESEEGARRCLEAFGEFGACLPSSIDPSGLQSINSYDGQVECPEQDQEIESSPKNDNLSSRSQMSKETVCSFNIHATGGRKRQVGADMTEEGSLAKKKKLTQSESSAHVLKMNPGNSEEKIIQDNILSSHSPENKRDSPNTKQSPKKKKKKRKQKKSAAKVSREEKLESESIQLRILPKKHWRQLRNRYLNLQRENMSKLKRQMRMQRFANQNDQLVNSEALKTAKSVCVKIELETPAKSAEVFKAQIGLDVVPKGWSNFLRYVDYNDGALDAVVRLAASEEGIYIFLENAKQNYKKATRLTDVETTEYWREVKVEQAFKKKEQKKRTRGKDRILNQAEKLVKHIRFDDESTKTEDKISVKSEAEMETEDLASKTE